MLNGLENLFLRRANLAKSSRDALHSRQAINYESLIVAYAMSRLDQRFLSALAQSSWRAAFAWAGERIGVKASSLKNLRDEFDPIHSNSRRGWVSRPMRRDRAEIVTNFSELPDAELMEVVRGVLSRDPTVEDQIVEPLADAHQRIANVAQRLRTGRLAEEFFFHNSADICGVITADLLDERQSAQGYDFAVRPRPSLRIEVKGLTSRTGDIVFTDLEWRVAREVRRDYWLVVVGCLASQPAAKVYTDPHRILRATEVIEQVQRVSWRSRVSVAC
jgi:Protein NO VEIN, C-terminal